MTKTGNLQATRFPELLEWAAEGSKTGALVIEKGHSENRVYFRRGEVIAVSSSDSEVSVADCVRRLGLVAEERLSAIIDELDGADELLGRYLVRHDEISESDLSGLMRTKTREAIFELFQWTSGDFHFEEDEKSDDSNAAFSLDMIEINEEIESRTKMWKKIRRFLPDASAIPVGIGFLNDPAFEAGQRAILKLVDDCSTVARIAQLSARSEYEVGCALVAALEGGRLKVVTPTDTGEGADNSLALSTGITLLDSDSLIGAATKHFENQDFETALRYMKAAKMLEPNNGDVTTRCGEMEGRISELLERAGICEPVIPRLTVSIDKIGDMGMSPNAGFLMTRVDGNSDLRSILKMTPLAPVEAKLLVYRLVQDGHLTLDEPKKR